MCRHGWQVEAESEVSSTWGFGVLVVVLISNCELILKKKLVLHLEVFVCYFYIWHWYGNRDAIDKFDILFEKFDLLTSF